MLDRRFFKPKQAAAEFKLSKNQKDKNGYIKVTFEQLQQYDRRDVAKSGLAANDVEAVVSKIAPIFMQRANENFKSNADSSNFLEMIRRSNLDEMADAPQNISVDEGNELLGVLTGSKENSRALASDVGSQLGISADSIKTLLPMIAPMIAGMLNNQLKASNLQGSADSGSMISMLTQFLDQNKDGSIVDDIFRIAGNFFGKK